jgi:hypothetical protein
VFTILRRAVVTPGRAGSCHFRAVPDTSQPGAITKGCACRVNEKPQTDQADGGMNFTTAAKPELNECGKRPLEAQTHSPLASLVHIFERSHRRDNILADIRLGNK